MERHPATLARSAQRANTGLPAKRTHTQPDLIIARLSARSAIENTVLESVLQRLGIALIYVDSELDPLVTVPRSIELLGHVPTCLGVPKS